MGATKRWAFFLIVLTTVLTTLAQYFLKAGIGQLPLLFTNVALLTGIGIYALGAFVMILAFKGGDVSSLYPVIATSYVWVALESWLFFGESIHWLRWLGIGVIIVGVSIVGLSGRQAATAEVL
jgi:drug/metabolite transporter (DMT)-like permease